MRFFLAPIALAMTGALLASAHPPDLAHSVNHSTNIHHTHPTVTGAGHSHTHSEGHGTDVSHHAKSTSAIADLTTPNPSKRDNPIYYNLKCAGDNLSGKARKCNNTDLNGDWCSKNCWCTWTGCMQCKGLGGCSNAVVVTTCAAVTKSWDCNCVGFGPKEGDIETCAVIP